MTFKSIFFKQYLVSSLVLCGVLLADAQESHCFLDIRDNSIQESYLIRKINLKVNEDVNQLPEKNKKDLTEIYLSRAENLVKQIERGDFYFDTSINDYFQGIFHDILIANPTINKQHLKLLISRYSFPNAYCMGEGTLVFNLELLPWLENESQIAFILCHELAHHQLNHVNAAIKERVDWFTSKETERELAKIAKSEYGTYDKALAFLSQNVFEDRRHSRLHEAEADALALKFLKNTRFAPQAAISCLAVLDKVDNSRLTTSFQLEKIFNSKDYPFKPHWVEHEESIFNKDIPSEVENLDSLKTHPDCTKRMALLAPFLSDKKVVNPSKDISNELSELIKQSDFELIQNDFLFGKFDRSLYNTLLLLEKYPNEACLHAMVGENLYQIAKIQIDRTSEHALERPGPHQKADYKDFLTFLQNLRLKELTKINYYYLQNKAEKYMDNQEFHYALLLATELVNQPLAYQKLKLSYQKKYRN